MGVSSSTTGGVRKAVASRAPDAPKLPCPAVQIVGPPGDRHLVAVFWDGKGTQGGQGIRGSRRSRGQSLGSGILAEAGAMVWMTPDVTVETSLSGGVLKALKRVLASETAFVNMFSGVSGSVALAPDFPCDILEIFVPAGNSLELAAGAFLACEDGLTVSGRLTLLGGLLGQKDLVSTVVKNETQRGRRVWIAGNGFARAHALAGEADRLCVDNHRVLACTPGTKSNVDTAGGGLVSAVFGGEGIVTCFSGPGTVWTQTRRSFPYLIEKVAASRDSGGVVVVGGVAPVPIGVSDSRPSEPDEPDEPSEPDAAEQSEGGGKKKKTAGRKSKNGGPTGLRRLRHGIPLGNPRRGS